MYYLAYGRTFATPEAAKAYDEAAKELFVLSVEETARMCKITELRAQIDSLNKELRLVYEAKMEIAEARNLAELKAKSAGSEEVIPPFYGFSGAHNDL